MSCCCHCLCFKKSDFETPKNTEESNKNNLDLERTEKKSDYFPLNIGEESKNMKEPQYPTNINQSKPNQDCNEQMRVNKFPNFHKENKKRASRAKEIALKSNIQESEKHQVKSKNDSPKKLSHQITENLENYDEKKEFINDKKAKELDESFKQDAVKPQKKINQVKSKNDSPQKLSHQISENPENIDENEIINDKKAKMLDESFKQDTKKPLINVDQMESKNDSPLKLSHQISENPENIDENEIINDKKDSGLDESFKQDAAKPLINIDQMKSKNDSPQKLSHQIIVNLENIDEKKEFINDKKAKELDESFKQDAKKPQKKINQVKSKNDSPKKLSHQISENPEIIDENEIINNKKAKELDESFKLDAKKSLINVDQMESKNDSPLKLSHQISENPENIDKKEIINDKKAKELDESFKQDAVKPQKKINQVKSKNDSPKKLSHQISENPENFDENEIINDIKGKELDESFKQDAVKPQKKINQVKSKNDSPKKLSHQISENPENIDENEIINDKKAKEFDKSFKGDAVKPQKKINQMKFKNDSPLKLSHQISENPENEIINDKKAKELDESSKQDAVKHQKKINQMKSKNDSPKKLSHQISENLENIDEKEIINGKKAKELDESFKQDAVKPQKKINQMKSKNDSPLKLSHQISENPENIDENEIINDKKAKMLDESFKLEAVKPQKNVNQPKAQSIVNFKQDFEEPLKNIQLEAPTNVEIPGKKQRDKPLDAERNIGLINIGNSCYMNSVIQILSSIPEFCANVEASAKSALLKSLGKVISILLSHSSDDNDMRKHLVEFRNAISEQYPMFKGPSENDAKELFAITTDEVDQLNPNSKQFTLTKTQLFTCCANRDHQSSNTDETNFLLVPKQKQRDLQMFINTIKNKITYNENNKLFCDKCHELRDIDLEIVSINWPNILAFYLPPAKIRLSLPENLEAEEFRYKIFGAICYYGNHFIAFVKDNNRGLWKRFNDSMVNWGDPDWDCLYLVFYRKLN